MTLHDDSGASRSLERTVTFEKTSANTVEARKHLELLLEQLRLRTLETQLAKEARRKRERILERQLTIEVER